MCLYCILFLFCLFCYVYCISELKVVVWYWNYSFNFELLIKFFVVGVFGYSVCVCVVFGDKFDNCERRKGNLLEMVVRGFMVI